TALASGAEMTPWWSDAIQPTSGGGGQGFGYWLAQRPIIDKDGKITVLGNSWVGYFFAEFKAKIEARLPCTTTVNAGIAGNRAADMLARFDTDVPADSDYVLINEPGVNDAPTTTLDTQAPQVAQLVAKIRAIGAISV